ncbi:ABC-type multidrug transport system, ATPase component [Duganella sp. CF458]|uniref:ATP-binding cassette domain-containing protein n=1 Tax=Duganella sp. CF458 TaxID=1884368 RepID=UPI0008E101A8|nr:ABC transporter ATP-binding protein [Duganella sp. CF458]SFF86113.1 ABC-type multidrug transport system, ATPase component [Duganella sp. CF458]
MNDAPGWQDSELWLRDAAGAVLRLAAAGDSEGAEQALERLFALRGRFHAYPVLQDMLAGRRAWRACGSVHALGDTELPPALLRNFDEAVSACAAFLGLPPPCILLQCVPSERDMHLTMESLPGLAMVRLSTQSDGYADGLRAVVFHEVAHCFLTCGVRLLDEGLAQLFANRFGGATPLPRRPELSPPLRAMLSRDGNAMFGASTGAGVDAYRAACRLGADLLESVDARGGPAAIVALFRDVTRAATDARIAELAVQASGLPVAAAGPQDAGPGAGAGSGYAALIEQSQQAIFAAWSSKRAEELSDSIALLEAEPVFTQPTLLDALLGARLNQALLHVHGGAKLAPEEEAAIDALLKATDILPAGRQWLWRGVRAILAILLAQPNIIKVATAGQNALHAFGKAQELIAGDPDLLIHHASLLLHAPPNYGGDRDRGAGMLREAMQHPLYRAHAREMLLENDIDPGDEVVAIAPSAPEPAALPAQQAALALEARGIELRLPSGFTLAPGDLVLYQGERVAVVGPNGSGKTILLEALLGLRAPDSGKIRLAIGDPRNAKVRQQLGGLLQSADLPGQMRVGEIMTMHETIYARTEPAVTRALGMEELRSKLWQQLSRGQKQRVMLWLALSHVPALALLDEPSLGLDEWHARALRELLAGMPTTVLQISHIPADLLGMDRILCMEKGRLVDSGTLDELLARRVGRFKARIGQVLGGEAAQAMHALPALLRAEATQEGWQLRGEPGFDAGFRRFIEQHGIANFSLEASSIEDFLADLTKGDNA